MRLRHSLAALLPVAALLVLPGTATAADADLAARWAPIHYQDTDSSDADADYLSAIDYDGNWDGLDNWEHQDDSAARLTGAVYYSVTETSTHWFLVYGFFHPRDWDDQPDPLSRNTHENDMEGVLLTVRKDGSTYGKAEAMITIAHSDFYSYVPAGSPYTGGRESVDAVLPMQTHNGVAHPTTRQEAKGHGCYAGNGTTFPGGDGVVYYPGTTGEAPSGGNDRSVSYRLVNIFATGGLWSHRADSATFATWGTFRGDNGKDNAANPPWGWDDANDGDDLPRGMFTSHPAYLVSQYFANEGSFSQAYLNNPYES
ncbi:hypothetical protein L3Q67_38155 [Saccharothrix sp. AJ9571]|nr:hypothetical protein L3Q67_38155 [Saccharothrix sp. AJ9571]